MHSRSPSSRELTADWYYYTLGSRSVADRPCAGNVRGPRSQGGQVMDMDLASVLGTPLSRRQALHRAALLALGLGGLRAATSPLVAAAAERAAAQSPVLGSSYSGAITMVPWAFLPTPTMKPTALYPYPQNGIDILAKAWQKNHPRATFRWVKQWSTDAAYQTWLTTQMTGGTEPVVCFWWPPSDQFVQDGKEINIEPYLD